jgi:hypothetical protein
MDVPVSPTAPNRWHAPSSWRQVELAVLMLADAELVDLYLAPVCGSCC